MKNSAIYTNYIKTPAGFLKVLSIDIGIFEAKFCFSTEDFTYKPRFETENLILHGTEFEISVWNKLLDIPVGKTLSYQDIAKAINKPKACRAVGNAIGNNNILYFIPCHRVLLKSSKIGGYAGGVEIKKDLLEAEKSNFII